MNATEKDKSNQSEAARLYERSSEKNRNLFLFYLGAIVYILITVASTTDLDLLLSEKLLILPVLSVGIPLLSFYLSASLLVLILHFSLLHNTTEHLKKIKQWEKEENGESISSRLMHPYIFDFAYLSPSGRWGNILVYSTNFLLYFLAPVCLFCIQLRFSNYQSLLYSSWHFICLSADLYLLILFFNPDHDSSDKKQDSSDSKGVAEFFKYIGKLLKAFVITLIKDIGKLHKESGKRFSVIILFFFFGFANFWIVGMLQFERSITWLEKSHGFIAPKITIPPGSRIQKQSLEGLKLIAIQIDTNKTEAWKSHGGNYDLRGRRLVFSDLSNSYMQKIVLIEAHLQNSNMSMAQMQGADMSDAKLKGADMIGVELQDATMQGTQMQGAKMQGAHMQGAKMQGAHMQGADMQGSQIQGAKMQGAHMQGADMSKAQLQGTDMSKVELQGADMRRAELQGANMSNAQLQGADMSNTELQGANIQDAKFSGADMEKANLRGGFCREEGYDGFFDRINARIGVGGLEGCNAIDSQFGVLTEVTVDSIIKSLHSNENIPKEIADKIEENINKRVGKASSMVEVKIGVLNLEEACEIIKNWQEGVKNVPNLKDAYADWLATEAGKKSRLKDCPTSI